jgi:hypothetical protein
LSRARFLDALAGGELKEHAAHTAPIGAGKSRALRDLRTRLEDRDVRCAFIDLFTAASTPEALTEAILASLDPRGRGDAVARARRAALAGATPSRRLLGLLEELASAPPVDAWLVDEVSEIRSLAYFPDLSEVERPFESMLRAAPRAIAASSYAGLVRAYLPNLAEVPLEPIAAADLVGVAPDVAAAAATFSGGLAAGATAIAEHGVRSVDDLARLFEPGAALEMICRRHYDVLLMRSRGYAVCKIAAEAVARNPGARLTDLVPVIGRTPGASRQYLFWLVEVGLLAQTRKRYDFADPLLGLWARIYLRAEGAGDVRATVAAWAREREAPAPPVPGDAGRPARRVDRFEEIF